jgi:ATP-dependent DNA helicase RecQ
MPTGGGKSLCYQLPALILEGITIVISPLIALMKDQVDSLNRVGIPATFINSSISPNDTKARLESVGRGHFKLLYVAPERFYSQEFVEALKKIKVSLFAVDEAHCISSWGHDFRPSYIRLKHAIQELGNPLVMALTATATPEVREDIVKQLALEKSKLVITGFARPNLIFSVIRANEGAKPHFVLEAIRSAESGAGVVYVSTRNRADELLQVLIDNGIDAIGYHAGLEPQERKNVQEMFMKNKAKVIVATNAFGLGIDKSDVRFVIHYDMPGTVEAYYQEAGRAGRDGKPSHCLLLYNSRDRVLQEFFIKGDNPSPELILELYQVLLDYGTDRVLVTYSELGKQLSDVGPDMAIGTAVKILEREGLIRRAQDKAANAYLKIFKAKTEVLLIFGARAKKQLQVLEKLYSKFGDQILHGFDFNLDEVALILDTTKDSLRRFIKKLEEHGLAEYKPPFKGTEIEILKHLDIKDVKFDREALKNKLKQAYSKLDAIENYVFSSGCRAGYISEYFGELGKRCGQCDNCQMRGVSLAEPLEASGRIDFDAVFGALEASDIEVASPVSTKLTQLETFDLYNQGLSIEEMAQTRNLKPATIVEHLCFLLNAKMAVDVRRFVSPEIEERIIEVIRSLGKERLAPIKEALGEEIGWNEIKLVMAQN